LISPTYYLSVVQHFETKFILTPNLVTQNFICMSNSFKYLRQVAFGCGFHAFIICMQSVQSNESGPFPLSNALYTATPIKIKQKMEKEKLIWKRETPLNNNEVLPCLTYKFFFGHFKIEKKVVIYREDTLIYWLQMLLDLQNWCFCR
jgi:hypothetical protein